MHRVCLYFVLPHTFRYILYFYFKRLKKKERQRNRIIKGNNKRQKGLVVIATEISIHTWMSVPRLSACSLVFKSRKRKKEDNRERELYRNPFQFSIIISFPNPKLTHYILFILRSTSINCPNFRRRRKWGIHHQQQQQQQVFN